MSSLRVAIEELLAPADVRIDGTRPWDVRVRDERFFARVLAEGSLGLGESYMDGWWDCEHFRSRFGCLCGFLSWCLRGTNNFSAELFAGVIWWESSSPSRWPNLDRGFTDQWKIRQQQF